MAYVHTIRKSITGIMSYCEKRNESIFKLRQKGWSFGELAEKYHMTPQRAGQIVRQLEAAAKKRGKLKRAS